MKLAITGATGFVGSNILNEALNRGHEVTAVTRHLDKLPKHSRLVPKHADVFDEAALAAAFRGNAAVISAFSPGKTDPDIRDKHLQGIRSTIAAMKQVGIRRLLVVGGGGESRSQTRCSSDRCARFSRTVEGHRSRHGRRSAIATT